MTWITELLDAVAGLPLPAILLAAALFSFVESGLGIGMLVPGETGVLVLGATVDGAVRFTLLLVVVTAGACAGDHVGYLLGRRFGTRLRDTALVRRIGRSHWDRATEAVQRHGAAAVFLTRLLPIVRTLTPAAAGIAKVGYARFLPASLAGALCWATVYVGIGAFAGASTRTAEELVGTLGWLALAVLVAAVVIAVRVRHARRARTAEPLPGEPLPGDPLPEETPERG